MSSRAFLGPSWSRRGAFAGPSWGRLGALSGPPLEPSWGRLGNPRGPRSSPKVNKHRSAVSLAQREP
eukprot:9430270-Pyramimonas_sp.AAC.1